MPECVEQWSKISSTLYSPDGSATGHNGVPKVAPGVNPMAGLS